MSFKTWLWCRKWLNRLTRRRVTRRFVRSLPSFRPWLEQLECREVPAVVGPLPISSALTYQDYTAGIIAPSQALTNLGIQHTDYNENGGAPGNFASFLSAVSSADPARTLVV